MNSLIFHLLYLGAALYVLHLWRIDLRNAIAGIGSAAQALPGATPASRFILAVAMGGSLLLVAIETTGEYLLNLHHEQSTLAWHFIFALIAAAIVEEVIFRGYLVIPDHGPLVLWISIVFFSGVFALLHPFLWSFSMEEGASMRELHRAHITWDFSTKAWFSTGFIFSSSLWFYGMRFNRWNPQRSLLPCFAAHLASNLGVYLIKAAQGFVSLS